MPGRDEITEDYIEYADLVVYQRKKGYRFSLDSILIADFATRQGVNGKVLDVGTGCGVVAMLIARLNRGVERVIAVEVQEALARLAMKNVIKNGLTDRIEVVHAEVTEYMERAGMKFDGIVSNPPFRRLDGGRKNPDEEKRVARHEYMLNLPGLSSCISRGLKADGVFVMIYPAGRYPEVVCQLNLDGLKAEEVRLVHSFPEKEAEFFLMKGGLGTQKETLFLPPLFVYERLNVYSEELKNIYGGYLRK